MDGCLFCRIVAKELSVRGVYEDGDLMAFYDINPQAPLHVLVIPKKHIASLREAEGENEILGKLMAAARALATDLGLGEKGFRVVINTGADGGQTVNHLHLHLLGGRRLQWPPG